MLKIKENLSTPKWIYGLLVIWGTMTHGLLLLNDGIYWDGWPLYFHSLERNWSYVYTPFRNSGLPFYALFHWLIGYLPHPIFFYRLAAFLFILGSALIIFKLCRKFLSQGDSLLVALMTISYPVYSTLVAFTMVPAQMSYFCFFLAVYLAFLYEEKSQPRPLLLRLSILLLFIVGFMWRSFLVMYAGFIVFLLAHVRNLYGQSIKNLLFNFLPRRIDYLVLPVVYWFVNGHLFPPRGAYAEENIITGSPFLYARCVYNFFKFFYLQFDGVFQSFIHSPGIWMTALFLMVSFLARYKENLGALFENKVKMPHLLGASFLLLFLSIVPYVAVGKWPAGGWMCRHALLTSFPLSLFMVALVRLILPNNKKVISFLGMSILIFFIFGFASLTIREYIAWQARWVKDEAILRNLKDYDTVPGDRRPLNKFSVFWIDDQFPVGKEDHYHFFEWAGIFKTLWHDESHIGLDQRYYGGPFLFDPGQDRLVTHDMLLKDFDRFGCQAKIKIRPYWRAGGEVDMAVRYMAYKMISQEMLSAYLAGLIKLEFETFYHERSVNCKELQ